MALKPQHIHIGAGALGLGLVVPSTLAQYNVRVLNRRSAGSQGSMKALLEAGRGYLLRPHSAAPEIVGDATFEFYDPLLAASADHPVVRSVADPRTSLVTTAVGPEGLPPVAALIAQGIASRTDGPVTVLACENAANARLVIVQALEAAGMNVASRAIVPETLVDRMCRPLWVSGNRVVVEVEDHSAWLIEESDSPDGVLLRKFAEILPPPALAAARVRKLWLMNGTDLILALRAKNVPSVLVRDGLDDLGRRRVEAFGLLAAIALHILAAERRVVSRGFDVQSNLSWHARAIRRIQEGANETARVLREYAGRVANPVLWLAKVNERITRPISSGLNPLLRTEVGPPLDDRLRAASIAGELLCDLLLGLEGALRGAPSALTEIDES